MATQSSVLAWRIPGEGEPEGLPSMGSHRVGHDWSDLTTVLCQHSEVVLWNFLSVEMIFRWISGGESGLPVLFLCHLRTATLLILNFQKYLWLIKWNNFNIVWLLICVEVMLAKKESKGTYMDVRVLRFTWNGRIFSLSRMWKLRYTLFKISRTLIYEIEYKETWPKANNQI